MRRSFTLFSLAILFSSAMRLVAQQREQPPEGAPPKPFHSPARTTFTAGTGLPVTLAQFGLIPKVTIELVVRGGEITEPKGKDGLGTLMGELMKEGTSSLTAEQIAQKAALLGGSLSVDTDSDEIIVRGDALSESAARMIELLADLALHPKFPESELQRLKKDQLRNIAIAKTQPKVIAAQAFRKVVYGDNGYGRVIPDEAALGSITLDEIKAYYARHFIPSNAHLYVTGLFSPDLRSAIETAFSGWPKGDNPPVPEIKAQTKHTLELVDRPGAPQSTLAIGTPVIGPESGDYIPLEVTNSLLGGSFMSRITSNIREQKGYTYSPRSALETNAENAVWVEHADVTTKFTGESLKEIFGEMNGLRREGPPQKELKGIQNGIAGVFILRNSSRQGIINILKMIDLHHLPPDYIDSYLPKMFAVTPSQVQGISEKYLDPAKMTVVVVGDKAQVESQIAPYKPGTN